ncbi:MAG: FliA/WhiG family RNA polymerase sigma factor [Acidobacteria bacterium]|nr:FliA/WhiG family RNA polymerase sigma factor [Acidobacteriota bacterium]
MRLKADAAGPADVDDRNRLVMAHIGLVKSLASRLAHRVPAHVEISELISVGTLGLIDAAGRYEPALRVPFDAYARRRIHGAMLDALRDLDWAPRSLRRRGRAIETAMTRLRHELGREPESADIARALNVSEEDYDHLLDQLRSVELASIRQSTDGDGGTRLDVAIDPDEGPHAQLERTELRTLLARAVAELPERERQVLALYYEEELTLAEIGQVIGVGESRVSQLRAQAVARLRSHLAASMRSAAKSDR